MKSFYIYLYKGYSLNKGIFFLKSEMNFFSEFFSP